MESSRRITTIMIGVAIIALIALSLSIDRTGRDSGDVPESESVPGLAANLRSLEKLTEFPTSHIRSVIVYRTNGEQLTLSRPALDAPYFEINSGSPVESLTPFSAILYANATFLDNIASAEAFVVTGVDNKEEIGRLVYTSYDGLVLEQSVLRGTDASYLRIVAAHSPRLSARFKEEPLMQEMYPANQVIDVANRLNGRVYRSTTAGP